MKSKPALNVPTVVVDEEVVATAVEIVVEIAETGPVAEVVEIVEVLRVVQMVLPPSMIRLPSLPWLKYNFGLGSFDIKKKSPYFLAGVSPWKKERASDTVTFCNVLAYNLISLFSLPSLYFSFAITKNIMIEFTAYRIKAER